MQMEQTCTATEKTDRDAVLIERLAIVAPKLIKRAYTRSQTTPQEECVLLARLAYDVLQHLDIAATPTDFAVTVWNARYETYRETGIDHADAYRHTNDPLTLIQSGVDVSGGAKIHLAVVIPSTSQLIDLSVWQLSRAHRGIQLPSALCLPWDGCRARYDSTMGHVEYRPLPVIEGRRPPPLHERREWELTRSMLRGLAKVIAKRVRR